MSEYVLIAATNSKHKVREISEMLPEGWTLKALNDVGYHHEILENGTSLEENALIKARTLYDFLSQNVFAEDTGLEVEALLGAPGVHTARYAGEERSDDKNIDLLLTNLKSEPNRSAQFRTVIALIYQGEEYLFEGIVEGSIAQEPSGQSGFGYDPIFIPKGYTKTFAELPAETKNDISHRAKAVKKLLEFLTKQ